MESKPKERVSFFNIFGVLYPLGIYFLIQFVVVILFTIYLAAMNPELAADRSKADEFNDLVMGYSITMTLICDAILIPIMIVIMRFDLKKLSKRGYDRVLQNVSYAKYLLVIPFSFIGMMVCNFLATFALNALPDSFTKSYDSAAAAIYSGDKVSMVIAVAIVGPILEELLFRGVVYNRIKDMFNPVVAIISSAIIFGIFHMNWVQGIYASTLGILLAYLYYKYKTIYASIIMHMTCNTISLIATFLSKEGVKGAAKGTEKVQITSAMLSSFLVYSLLLVGAIAIINSKVKVKELFVLRTNQNPYGKYDELNGNGYNQSANGYNDQLIDEYLSQQGGNDNGNNQL